MEDLSLSDAKHPTRIWNDNRNCVDWSSGMIPKAVRHVNIRDSAVRDSVRNCEIDIKHIDGHLNPADLFTKEMRDVSHFLRLRDLVVRSRH